MRLLTIFACASLGLAAASPLGRAQSYTTSTIYQFCSLPKCADGYLPISGLIQGADGNFYGETEKGGTSDEGTIFKLSPAGSLTTLRQPGEEGSSIIQGGDGNYYYPIRGDFLKMSSSGNATVLESTATVYGSLFIEGSDGNFYAYSSYGGQNTDYGCGSYCGTVIKITPKGTVSVLYQFCSVANCADGGGGATLLEGSDGTFYGVTAYGINGGYGTIFKLTKSGALTTLYNFNADSYGSGPLVEGPDGNFYGLTTSGQGLCLTGCGFKISPSGTYTTIFGFCTEGDTNQCNYEYVAGPGAGFFLGSDGNFYGVADGYLFYLIYAGEIAIADYVGGGLPIQGSDGNFYGTDSEGGLSASECANNNGENYGCGIVYKVAHSPGLPPPVQVSLSSSQVLPGKPVTVSLKVLNAFSLTMQQCYAFQNGTPLGKVPGTYNSSTKLYTFSTSFTPTTAGTYNYAVTCGGVESGFATLTVGDTTQTTLAATPNPVTPPANVSLTATVTRTTGAGVPTGSVTFYYETDALGNLCTSPSTSA